MNLSLFLAKLIGLYLIIISLIWLFRKNKLETASKEALKEPAIIAFSGVFSLLVGLAIIIDHSIWEISYKGLITLIGWLVIFISILRLGFPKQYRSLSQFLLQHRYAAITILLLVGIYLVYEGFML